MMCHYLLGITMICRYLRGITFLSEPPNIAANLLHATAKFAASLTLFMESCLGKSAVSFVKHSLLLERHERGDPRPWRHQLFQQTG